MTGHALATTAIARREQPQARAGQGGLAFVVSEFRRARAAEQRYGELRRNLTGAPVRNCRGDISQQVFEEFYSEAAQS